jgi:hypothetical protein
MSKTSAVALFAAAGLFVGGLGVPSAMAADLGGDCCADLEERVAELEATTARKGNRRVSLTISGQVVTEIMHWNDGNSTQGSDTYIVDGTHAGGTFVSFSGSARINPNLAAGFNITMAMCSGARSHHVNQLDDDASTPAGTCFNGAGDSTFVTTLANWYLDHKALGRVTVGRINTATAGITTIDLGGAGVIANSAIGYWQRGMSLVNSANDALIAPSWSTAMGGNSVNGASLSRANAVSYTSPTFGGFSVAAAWGEDDIWDIGLRYAGEFSGFRVAAGIGYISNSSGLNEVTKDHAVGSEPSQVKGSASVLHVASGLYLTGAYLQQDNDASSTTLGGQTFARPDTTLWYVQGGISKNWTGLGNTVLYGEYARIDDPTSGLLANSGGFGGIDDFVLVASSSATMWGLGVVQHIDAAAMEVYLAYRRYTYDQTGCDTFVANPCVAGGGPIPGVFDINDMDVIMSGARIRF